MNLLPLKVTPSIVYLTGGICSGKSSARAEFEKLGVPCIDADKVAHKLYDDRESEASLEIQHNFPAAIDRLGFVDRKSLRAIISANPADNSRLVSIMTPHVMKYLLDWSLSQDYCYVIWESAIVVDTKAAATRILVIDVNEEAQISRLARRNPDWSAEEVSGILRQQLSRNERLRLADDTIDNSSHELSLRDSVLAMHEKYLTLWNNKND